MPDEPTTMSQFELQSVPTRRKRLTASTADLDLALTAQLLVAWAGEAGDDEPRLGWWRTDLVSEYGGVDLFQRLLPDTWEWAVLQGTREAARRVDAAGRARDHDPDRLCSLFRFGFELDERLTERLQDLKRAGGRPAEALPALGPFIDGEWDVDRFATWVASHGSVTTESSPTGRRLKGTPPTRLGDLVRALLAALHPLPQRYPLPHVRLPT